VISRGRLPEVGIGYSLKTPEVVIRPILFSLFSATQRLPSWPAAITQSALKVGTTYVVLDPEVVIRPIRSGLP
jgi:hypothetical protein